MVAKKFILKEDARKAMLRGVEKLKDAVCVTLGASGLNVAIHKQFDYPEITKDGITVASTMSLADENEDVGLQLVKNASRQTVNETGDGTTTAICLAHAIFSKCLKLLEERKCDENQLKDFLEEYCELTLKTLDKISTKIEKYEREAYNVAYTASNRDCDIACIVHEAYKKMGIDGAIELVATRKQTSDIKFLKGYKFENGYLSTAFVNIRSKMRTEFDNPYILLYDGRIDSTSKLIDLFNKVVTEEKEILIIAQDYSDTVLKTFIHNVQSNTLRVCAVRAPFYASQRTELLEDLAVLTGGKVITPKIDGGLEKAEEKVGSAKKVIVNGFSTSIIDGNCDENELKDRIEAIKHTQEIRDNPELNDSYNKKRIAKMTNGVAVIEVGGATSAEIVERQARALDAMLAVKASIEEGIVPGGGIALMLVRERLFNRSEDPLHDTFMQILEAPARQILQNANENVNDIILSIYEKNKSEQNIGWDTSKHSMADMLQEGIVDPVKVTKSAFKNAISVAILMLTTGCILSDAVVDPASQINPPQR